MNVAWYYSFLALAEYGSYQKASEKLFISHTTIYKHIKKLEDFLQMQLVTTLRKEIILTKAGRTILPFAQEFVSSFKKNILPLQNGATDSVPINIGVSPYIANFIMIPFISDLRKTDPTIHISLHMIAKDKMEQALERNELDIIISQTKITADNIRCDYFSEGQLALLVPNTKDTEDIEDEAYYLKKYPLCYNNHPQFGVPIKKELFKSFPNIKFWAIENVLVSKGLVQAQEGISYLPEHIVNTGDSRIKVVRSTLFPKMNSYVHFSTLKQAENEEIRSIKNVFRKFIEKLDKS